MIYKKQIPKFPNKMSDTYSEITNHNTRKGIMQ